MIIIADNLNTRNRAYMEALAARDKKAVSEIVKKLDIADMINVQCSLDGSGDEDALPWVTGIISDSIDKAVSLDSRNTDALRECIGICPQPPLINFLSLSDPEDPDELLELVARSGASLVLRASRATPPITLEAKLQIIEELLETANSFDIPNERLFADPSIVHIGRGVGQRHLANSADFLRVLREIVEPPVNTIVWVSNVSGGMPSMLRKSVESAFFLYASGAGVDAAMVDVLNPTIRNAIYLVRSFRDEIVFSPADMV